MKLFKIILNNDIGKGIFACVISVILCIITALLHSCFTPGSFLSVITALAVLGSFVMAVISAATALISFLGW